MQPNIVKWRVAAALWMGLIFTLSSSWFAPQFSFDGTLDVFGMLNHVVRKSAHSAEFAILMVLCFRSLHPWPFEVGQAGFLAALISLTYAASDELHQSFVPLRSGKATDVLFDAAGILVVAFLIRRIYLSDSDEHRTKFLGSPPESAAR